MSTVFTTSYSNSHLQTKIIDFVKNTNPKLVIEIGTQQGASAILIGKALAAKSKIITIDSFESEYIEPPYAKTHANFKITISNLEKANLVCEWAVVKGTENKLKELITEDLGLVHIDVCNHYNNLPSLIKLFDNSSNKAFILEGGIHNKWQKKYKYKPWNIIFKEKWFNTCWDYTVVEANNHNAVTLCTRKEL